MAKQKKSDSLSITHPKLAAQAVGWDPSSVTHGSTRKLAWKCFKGHIFQATPNSRTGNQTGCPICSNKLILAGFNDLATTHPEIAREADGWDPKTVIAGSEKKMKWRCPKGHFYEAIPGARTGNRKTGCPFCANQLVLKGYNDLATTHPEIAKQADGWDPSKVISGSNVKKLWKCSSGHKWEIGVGNRTGTRNSGCPICANQKLLTGYNDLATTHPEIAKEADGWDPKTIIAGTGKKLSWKCGKGHKFESAVGSRTGKQARGCPICANKKLLTGFNDLATTHPEIAKEADGWDPSKIIAGSNLKKKWKCSNGHQYTAMLNSRSSRNSGCGYCSNHRVLPGFNDLSTRFPEIAKEAHGWDPTKVMPGSMSKKTWKCENGHLYESAPVGRTGHNRTGCSVCANLQVLIGFNDLATTHPEIAKEADGWDPTKIVAGIEKKLGWKCPVGHKYIAMPGTRTKNNGSKCPVCANQQLLVGFNDLASTHPEIAREADGWDPKTVIAGTNKKLWWKCPEGHSYRTGGNHRIGDNATGCPTCAKSGFDPNLDGYLYFLSHSRWDMLQIGITNFPEKRTNTHKKLGWEVVEIRGPMDGHLTQQWETAILQMLKSKGADLANKAIVGKFDGYSEAWSTSKFKVDSIKQLMHLTEGFEEESKPRS